MLGPVLGTGERKRGVYCPNLTGPWRKWFPGHTQFMHTRLCTSSWSEPGSLGRQKWSQHITLLWVRSRLISEVFGAVSVSRVKLTV